ncbi:Gfo/Idh/MocA family oxidoreductase [Candidatus Poribacteria bacterium]|nr:Gfo/Idh/MocA family oxidoreductase [Candidatus Poribacteria bacterium]
MLGVGAYYNIHELVKDKPMEAAIVVTPIPSHHSISVYLSSHGVHNMCETTWCSTVGQAREMLQTARENNVIVRVAENFFRFSIDRFAQSLRDSGYLGRIGRIFSYNDHTGYHNNSRWIAFAQAHPLWVGAIEHTMPTVSFYSTPQRFHERETFRARYFGFPENFLVVDSASNVKGFLGRQSRPGHTEWQGERGTLVHRPERTELRYCSEGRRHQKSDPPGKGGGKPDQVYPVKQEMGEDGQWLRTYCETADGVIEYINPHRLDGYREKDMGYNCAIADHITDFTLAVRGLRESEFDEEDAMMSLMMDVGAKESAMNEGKRMGLPLEGETEADAQTRTALKQEYGVDPMDVEAMLTISYPKP